MEQCKRKSNDCREPCCTKAWTCPCWETFGPFSNRRCRRVVLQRHAKQCDKAIRVLTAQTVPEQAVNALAVSSRKRVRACTSADDCDCPACKTPTVCKGCRHVLGPFTNRNSRLTALRAHVGRCKKGKVSDNCSKYKTKSPEKTTVLVEKANVQ